VTRDPPNMEYKTDLTVIGYEHVNCVYKAHERDPW
jgi:hypothetical protein